MKSCQQIVNSLVIYWSSISVPQYMSLKWVA